MSHLSPARKDTILGHRVVPPPPMIVEGEEEYEVERVLKERRTRAGVTEYLVRWAGYDETEDQWLPEYELEHAKEAIAEFKAHAPQGGKGRRGRKRK